MARDETRRWKGWRTSQPGSAVRGSQPTKRPHAKRRRKLYPWYWITRTTAQKCGGCDRVIDAGEVFAFSRPNKARCERCIAVADEGVRGERHDRDLPEGR